VEVTQVVLETIIAASPAQKVNVKNWDYEGTEDFDNNSDVVLFF
jgi:hypothetical protein